jgi:hypothetical protein
MMDQTTESFAMTLFRRFSSGETIEQLAVSYGIPKDRVDQRVRAAALYAARLGAVDGLRKLGTELAEH